VYYIYQFYNKKEKLIYIGKTVNLNRRFISHFSEENWKPKETDKIMYAECKTKTDMDVYEVYYINKLKPKYNISLVNTDAPSFELEELDFKLYLDEDEILQSKNIKKFNNTLNLTDKRLIEIIIDKAKNGRNNTYQYYVIEIENKEYTKKFNTRVPFHFFENIIQKLKSKYILINKIQYNYIKYGFHESGKSILIFEKVVMNYLIENEIFYQIENTINNEVIKNKYSAILYYTMINNKDLMYSIQELKNIFRIKDEYEDYYDFKRRVLLPSIKEINNKTNINIEIEEIKDKRFIKSIKFNKKYKTNMEDAI